MLCHFQIQNFFSQGQVFSKKQEVTQAERLEGYGDGLITCF